MEQWRKTMLTEAAKNANDLITFVDNIQGDAWLRGLWDKYGLYRMSEFFNLGVTSDTMTRYRQGDKYRREHISKQFFDKMLKLGPPIPCMMATNMGNKLEVSYGAIIPKYVEPAVLLKFDTGEQKGKGTLMSKGSPMRGMPGGSITFKMAGSQYGGPCSGSFIVDSTYQTTKGWGPMLYDVAMEMATVLGGGLTSSRKMVSSHAKPVWDYYLNSRTDIEIGQLDISRQDSNRFGVKQLTPKVYEDDCDQEASIKWSHGEDYGAWNKPNLKYFGSKMNSMSDEEKKNVPWTKQSISKVFKKDPDIIKILGDKGLFHCPELGYDVKKFHSKDLPPPPKAEEEPLPPPPIEEGWAAAEKSRLRTNLSENKIRIKIK